MLVRIGDREQLVGPGECVFLPRGVVHAQTNPGEEPARFMALLIPAGFERCFHDLEVALGSGTSFSPEAIVPLLERYSVQAEAVTPRT